jgi:hypothetical protein
VSPLAHLQAQEANNELGGLGADRLLLEGDLDIRHGRVVHQPEHHQGRKQSQCARHASGLLRSAGIPKRGLQTRPLHPAHPALSRTTPHLFRSSVAAGDSRSTTGPCSSLLGTGTAMGLSRGFGEPVVVSSPLRVAAVSQSPPWRDGEGKTNLERSDEKAFQDHSESLKAVRQERPGVRDGSTPQEALGAGQDGEHRSLANAHRQETRVRVT